MWLARAGHCTATARRWVRASTLPRSRRRPRGDLDAPHGNPEPALFARNCVQLLDFKCDNSQAIAQHPIRDIAFVEFATRCANSHDLYPAAVHFDPQIVEVASREGAGDDADAGRTAAARR